MNKISMVSRIMKYLFGALFILLPIYTGLYWLSNGFPFGHWINLGIFPYAGPPLPTVSELNTPLKIYGFLINLVPISIYMTILYLLTRLFKQYEKKHIFTAVNVRYLRRIGWMMLLGELIYPAYMFLLSFTLTSDLPPGYHFAYVGVGLQNVLAIIVAVLIILISWIMAEGYKLQEESTFTV